MSRPCSPHTGDLDAVLRDDLALEQIAHGRRPRGADNAMRLLSALAEDVEIRVPRRRMRGSRLTRGVIATAVAATVLGVTGVAAAQPNSSDGFAFWAPRPGGTHVSAADRSLDEARWSIANGRTMEATAALDRADAELRQAGRGTHANRLRSVSTTLRSDLPRTSHPMPTTHQAVPSWKWAWGVPGGGPSWRPSRPPYQRCVLVVCLGGVDGTGNKVPYTPQQTPGAGGSFSSGGDTRAPLRINVPTVTAAPTTPGRPSPSIPGAPSATPPTGASPTRTTSTTNPTASP